MTPSQSITPIAETARVSIAERLVPCLSFGLSAIAGIVGGIMIFMLFEELRKAETAGREAVFSGFARIQLVVGGILAAAVLLGVVGIAVAAIRMFAAKRKASPSGAVFIVVGLLGLIPNLLIVYALSIGSDVITKGTGAANISQTINILTFAAMGLGVVAILAFVAFSFVPFSSSMGRKYSPVIFLIFVEIATVCLAAWFFWMASVSISHTSGAIWG
jgi:hypothetical protein